MLPGLIRLARLPQLVRCGVEPLAQRIGSAAIAIPAYLSPLRPAAFCSKISKSLVQGSLRSRCLCSALLALESKVVQGLRPLFLS
jgi:hypothetical protein